MYQRAGTSSGGGGGSAPELVWTNPNISNLEGATFDAQTIGENSSGWINGKHVADYDGFIVASVFNTTSYTTRGAGLSYISNDVSALATPFPTNYVPIVTSRNSDTGATINTRNATISSSGITFSASTGANSTDVPMYIWGVKGTLSNS